jgi:hypothetical protein
MISKFPHVLAFRLSLALAIPALLLPSCQKKSADPASNAVSAEKTNAIASELRSLEMEEEKLRREIEVERLAMEREELRLQREELESKSSRLTAEELELQRKKTALAEERADDLANKARSAAQSTTRPSSSPALRAEPVSPGGSTYQRPVSVSTNDYDYSVFYNRLSSHGRWFESPQYGYLWQPSIARSTSDWRPYTHGSWAYSDLGWTWVSTEPFGWAAYHYGRWVLLRNVGWCWVPGNEWAPAWVCWKSGGNYVGWAPLPPESLYWRGNDWNRYYGRSSGISPRCFTFVQSNTFGSNIYQSVFSTNECVRIYQKTQYIGGYEWSNNRVHCRGVDFTRICREIGRTLPRYECNLDTRLPSSFDPISYVNKRGNVLNVQAPSMRAPWNGALRPRAIERRLNDENVIREKTIAPEVLTQFVSSRQLDRQQAETSFRSGLAQKMHQRIELQEKIQAQRVELAEAVAINTPAADSSTKGNMERQDQLTPGFNAEPSAPRTGLAGRQQEQSPAATSEIVPPLNEDDSTHTPANPPAPQETAVAPELPRGESGTPENLTPPTQGEQPGNPPGMRGSLRDRQQAQQQAPTDAENSRPGLREASQNRQQQIQAEQQAAQQALEQAAMNEAEEQSDSAKAKAEVEAAQNAALRAAEMAAAEQNAAEQNAAQREAAELAQLQKQQEAEAQALAIIEQQQREEQMQAAQQEAENEAQARAAEEQAAAMREQQAAAEAQALQEAQMREQQEQQEQMRQQQEEAARQQQEEMRQQQQEQMRQQQEEAARQQQEEMRQQQQEQMRQQQEEAARQQQEEMRQQQQEQMRQQQEEAARQQQEQMREQQEAARQQQEEAARQQQSQ